MIGMKVRLAVSALDSAVARRDDFARPALRSDRGSQFHARKLRRLLAHHEMIRSTGHVGFSGDSAVMESFGSSLHQSACADPEQESVLPNGTLTRVRIHAWKYDV